MENDLVYRGGSDADVIAVMRKNLQATKMLKECMKNNQPLYDSINLPEECLTTIEKHLQSRVRKLLALPTTSK